MLKLADLKFNLWRAMNRRWVVGLRDESSELAINGGGRGVTIVARYDEQVWGVCLLRLRWFILAEQTKSEQKRGG
ncbi:hypothetical protein PYK22_01389 [Pyrinomonas methylaliphatogenes]|jgi:hypothetical protein|uniref:Uncharacterized protein n=1 Tax=Pyrinomonas methylaliphatogenes TaxID=454194 RepID=A0A0B6WZ00_9BACT|nr:hypothetical protein PYK22_01389 [Pyrinomonas methylaliphatogenes]